MYKILIKEKQNLFRFYTVSVPVTKDNMIETVDPSTREVKCICQKVPTGEYQKKIFEAKTLQDAEDMAKEVLKTYNMSQFCIVDELDYDLDMLFKDHDGDIIEQNPSPVVPGGSSSTDGSEST